MAFSRAPRLSPAAMFLELEENLPCARCSLAGPNPTYPAAESGRIAVCERCRPIVQPQRFENPRKNLAHSLHLSAPEGSAYA